MKRCSASNAPDPPAGGVVAPLARLGPAGSGWCWSYRRRKSAVRVVSSVVVMVTWEQPGTLGVFQFCWNVPSV